MDPYLPLLILLGLITAALACLLLKTLVWDTFFMPKARKRFLIKEMRHCLQTREKVYGAELINHCRTILHNIDLHCTMKDHFKQTFTYGEFDIGVNWYPIDGRFEFTVPPKYETIARIHYPG